MVVITGASAGFGRATACAFAEEGAKVGLLARGLVFSVFGSRIVLRRLLGMDLEMDEALIFHVGHAIYGIALGAWVGSNR